MSGRIVIIRHGDDPPDDRVYTYCHENGFTPDVRKPFKGEPIGYLAEDVVGSVVHGGPFNVFETDKHPFLLDEHRWIETCMANDVPLLGICQGGQSIAHVLDVYVGPRDGEPHEFGYYALHPTDAGKSVLPDSLHVVQAHFHEFEVPRGGELLAYSNAFPQQAFRYGQSTYAFQFHAEVTVEGFRRWQRDFSFYYGNPGVQTKEEQNRLMMEHDQRQASWFYGFLENLFSPNDR